MNPERLIYLTELNNLPLTDREELLNTQKLTNVELIFLIDSYKWHSSSEIQTQLTNIATHPNQNVPDEVLAHIIKKIQNSWKDYTDKPEEFTTPAPQTITSILTHPNAGEHTTKAYIKAWTSFTYFSKIGLRKHLTIYDCLQQDNLKTGNATLNKILKHETLPSTLASLIASIHYENGNIAKANQAINTALKLKLEDPKTVSYWHSTALPGNLSITTYRMLQNIDTNSDPTQKQKETLLKLITLNVILTIKTEQQDIPHSEPNHNQILQRTINTINRHPKSQQIKQTLTAPELPTDYQNKLLHLQIEETTATLLKKITRQDSLQQ